jgi:hypothetical protein
VFIERIDTVSLRRMKDRELKGWIQERVAAVQSIPPNP